MFIKTNVSLKNILSTKVTLPIVLLLASFSAFSQGNDLEQGIYDFNRGEFQAAIAQFRPLLSEGYAPAQYQMALIYQELTGEIMTSW
jgi:hypothetical protein